MIKYIKIKHIVLKISRGFTQTTEIPLKRSLIKESKHQILNYMGSV